MGRTLNTIQEAIEDFKNGKMVIMVDDEDRENEGDLIMPAEMVTPEAINFMTKYGRGLVCMPMTGDMLDRLQLPLMVEENQCKYQTAFTVSIEAAQGVTTGISAFDRAQTIKVAIDDKSTGRDVVSPGHVFPLRAKAGGVLFRSGHTEGTVDLARLAGFKPAGVLCEIMREDGHMARLPELLEFAALHDLKIISIADLIAYRMHHDCLIKEVANSTIPVPPHGDFNIRIFRSIVDGVEHSVLMKGEIDASKPTLVRVHSECLTGDVFGSARCDCGWQLKSSLAQIAREGGVLLYMAQEGRGIGLANKIRAYALQDKGLDTVEANHKLGFNDDHRDYGIGSQILRFIGVSKMRLLTNNPRKIYGLEGYGLEIVSRESIQSVPTDENKDYLMTKKEKLGHMLQLGEE